MAWYVVETYSGKDAEAEVALSDRGFPVYRPVVVTRTPHHRYAGVTCVHENHLTPGYLFVQVPPAYAKTRFDLSLIHGAAYVLCILGVDEDTPCEIPDITIETIREIEAYVANGGTFLEFWEELERKASEVSRIYQTGDDVFCQLGSKAYRGVVLKNRGSDRVTVELKMKGYLKRVNVNSAVLSAAA